MIDTSGLEDHLQAAFRMLERVKNFCQEERKRNNYDDACKKAIDNFMSALGNTLSLFVVEDANADYFNCNEYPRVLPIFFQWVEEYKKEKLLDIIESEKLRVQ